jgi:hypothetical protein
LLIAGCLLASVAVVAIARGKRRPAVGSKHAAVSTVLTEKEMSLLPEGAVASPCPVLPV